MLHYSCKSVLYWCIKMSASVGDDDTDLTLLISTDRREPVADVIDLVDGIPVSARLRRRRERQKSRKRIREADGVNAIDLTYNDETANTTTAIEAAQSISQSDEPAVTASAPPSVRCIICLEGAGGGGGDGDVVALRCGHVFHRVCVDDWLHHSDVRRCPQCRRTIPKRGSPYVRLYI